MVTQTITNIRKSKEIFTYTSWQSWK